MTYNNTLNALTNYLFFLGAHIGHLRVEAYQSMSNYIIGTRGLFTVIDLQKTVPMLKSAILFMERIVYNFGHALFCYSGIATLNMHLRHYFIRIVTERNQSFSH